MAISVMVVDDTKFMRIMLAEILRKLGCDVVAEVENGKGAIAKYKELKPDLVMMDITMPEMDGIRATQEIRLINAEALIIICSAGSQEDLIGEALRAGATDYLMKPFMPEKVKEIFDKVAPFLLLLAEEKQENEQQQQEEQPIVEHAAELLENNIELEATAPMLDRVELEVSDPIIDRVELETASEVEPAEIEAISLEESAVESVTEEEIRSREHRAGSNVVHLNKGGSPVNNFSSSYMCNWNEEVDNESVRFLALYAEGDHLISIEMLKADGQRQSIKVSLDGFRQLSQWLEDKAPNNRSGFCEVAK